MGVDYYHCKKCNECFHYDRFPQCILCEDDIGDCEYCVDEELCIFDDNCDDFKVICNICIKEGSINDIIDNLQERRLNLSTDKMLEKLNEMKQNIPTEKVLIERELNDVCREIKALTKRKKDLNKKLKNI
jgi:hypothetical protein